MPKSLNLNFNLSDNAKYGIGFFLALVFSVCCLIFIIFPLYRDNQVEKNKLLQANVKLATLQTFATQNQDYAALVKIQEMKMAEARKKLPDGVSVPELIAEYSKIADAAGVQLQGVTPGKTSKLGTAIALPISVDLEGDYFKLITFLQQVENGDRFVLVQGADYNAEKTGENLKMKAKFVVYALKKVDGAPSTDIKPATNNAKKPVPVDKAVGATK